MKIGGELLAVNEHGIYYNAQYGQAILTANVGAGVLDAYKWSDIFPTLTDPSTWNLSLLDPAVLSYKQNLGDAHFGVPRKTLGIWAQDDWRLTKRLTANLGLRYDNDFQSFNVTNRPSTTLGIYEPTHGDNNNIQPRLGLAWDPWGDSETVIRGGAGIYYSNTMETFVKKASMLNGVYDPIPSVTYVFQRDPILILRIPSTAPSRPQVSERTRANIRRQFLHWILKLRRQKQSKARLACSGI